MEKITIQEALRRTNNLLGDISVPIKMETAIGRPIRAAIENLSICIETLEMVSEEQGKEQSPAEEQGKQEGKANDEHGNV